MNATATAPASESHPWEFARVPRRQGDVVLDVAAGTGLAGRSLAGEVRQVIALDVSEAMLEIGRDEAAAAGIENMLFMRGDGSALPFLDGSFRVVLCGFALHHLSDPHVLLSEIKRVLLPHGWLGLADMVVAEDHEVAACQNRIERLRNPRFTRALSASELQDSLARLDYEVTGAETRTHRRSLDGWLTQTKTSEAVAAEIRSLLWAELAGAESTGLLPQVDGDGTLSLAHTHTSLVVLNRDV